MSRLVAIDPGKWACGVAIFDDGVLSRAAFVRATRTATDSPLERWVAMGRAVAGYVGTGARGRVELVSEVPRVYPQARGVDPMDLMELTGAVGTIAGFLGVPCRSYYPREWKGTIDGDAFVATRIMPRIRSMPAAVQARIEWPAASLRHNVADAIGLGLFALGGLAPRRVYDP